MTTSFANARAIRGKASCLPYAHDWRVANLAPLRDLFTSIAYRRAKEGETSLPPEVLLVCRRWQ